LSPDSVPLAAGWTTAGPGAAFCGGASGPQPPAQSLAPGHGAGGTGSPGALL